MEAHRHDETDPHHITQERRASLGNKGQRDPCHRKQTDIHSDIFKNVEGDHHDNAGSDIGIKFIFRIIDNFDHMIYKDKVGKDQERTAGKAEVFADRRKNHIRFPDRDINFTHTKAFTEDAARADRLEGLRYLIGRIGRPFMRPEPGIDPVKLIRTEKPSI